jgi:hypothetical protein
VTRYRKRPVEVEAIQWTGKNTDEVAAFLGADLLGQERSMDGPLIVRTQNGPVTVTRGEWLIRGVQGEHYPCRPDVFEATYEIAAPAGWPERSPTGGQARPVTTEEIQRAQGASG